MLPELVLTPSSQYSVRGLASAAIAVGTVFTIASENNAEADIRTNIKTLFPILVLFFKLILA
jgi:hypothetical protein